MKIFNRLRNKASEINLDPGTLLRMTAKTCRDRSARTTGRKCSAINDCVCKNAGTQVKKREKVRSRITVGKMWDMLTGSVITDLTHPSQNSRVFRLKDIVFLKKEMLCYCSVVCLFVCFFYIM